MRISVKLQEFHAYFGAIMDSIPRKPVPLGLCEGVFDIALTKGNAGTSSGVVIWAESAISKFVAQLQRSALGSQTTGTSVLKSHALQLMADRSAFHYIHDAMGWGKTCTGNLS
jgi:hypothetical protein